MRLALWAYLVVPACGKATNVSADAVPFPDYTPPITTYPDAALRLPHDTNGVWDDSFDGPTTLIIQESPLRNDAGFVGIFGTGSIASAQKTSTAGWTGDGYIENTDRSTHVVYSVHANFAGPASVSFRYAFGGNSANTRDAVLIVNGQTVSDVVPFPFTAPSENGLWNVWAKTTPVTIDLRAGENQIRLAPNATDPAVKALANLDYLEIVGHGLRPGDGSEILYRLDVSAADPARGNIQIVPAQDYYTDGDAVTVRATAAPGFVFESWTGTLPSTRAEYTFTVRGDTTLRARFLLPNAKQPEGLVGYGAVQDDQATPYVLTGGSEGPTVGASDLPTLRAYLESPAPYQVVVSGLITSGSDTVSTRIDVASNKTLVGDGTGHLRNIELSFSGENYIVRNLTVSQVVAADLYKGTGNDGLSFSGARHAFVDHCELFSTLAAPDPAYTGDAADYYDGLIDITNGARFITISNSYFHDHHKVMLIGSSDDPGRATVDGQSRVTLHHNRFRSVVSRLPLVRFGKAHVYNNFFEGTETRIDSTVNARRGATVLVEGNYTLNAKYTVGFFYDTSGASPGLWNLRDNTYVNCLETQVTPTTDFVPAYAFTADKSSAIPTLVTANAGVQAIFLP